MKTADVLSDVSGYQAYQRKTMDIDIDKSNGLFAKTFIVFMCLCLGAFEWFNLDNFEYAIITIRSCHLGFSYIVLCKAILIINLAALFWRFVLNFYYKPSVTCKNSQLPSCSVIVPAYNEGRQVLDTLNSILKSDYPTEKLQIIAVDDGSIDDTWMWMQKAADAAKGRILALQLQKNSGKRRALYEGFKKSTGDVLVTIDSDSVIQEDTLRNMTSPFYQDKKVGAVAGCVRVLNKNEDTIPKMLDVSFAFSFDFLRKSQSVVNTVFCTPGALAAYRKEALVPVLDAWLHQTFMGRPAAIGEDRALTNAILRTGYHVKYQSNAVVYTNVPTGYRQLSKMFLRWARSNVRETLVMASFIFRRFRATPAIGARVNFILSVINLIVSQIILLGTALCILWQPSVFITQVIFGAAVSAAVPAAFYFIRTQNTNALWAFPYSIFWVFSLSWIPFYAIFTAGNSEWLTRDISSIPPVDNKSGAAVSPYLAAGKLEPAAA
ncbi:MAG: glycosyltransferase [Phycisphaerae bacterium]|nr:glycosyltransferase [Phycisphaerae bacterium]